jgi:transposase
MINSDARYGSRSGDRLSRAPAVWTVNRSPLERGGPRGFDGGKHVKGRKRHILVDTLGLLWAVRVTPANVQDKTGLRWLLEDWGPFLRRLQLLWADGAYLSESLAAWLQARFGWQLVVTQPPIGSRGFAVAPKRWMVERTQPHYPLPLRTVQGVAAWGISSFRCSQWWRISSRVDRWWSRHKRSCSAGSAQIIHRCRPVGS